MNQRTKGILFVVGAVVLIVIFNIIDSRSDIERPKEERDRRSHAHVEVPDADIPQVSDSKSHAYSTFTDKDKKDGIEDYWDMCDEQMARQEEEREERPVTADILKGSSQGSSSSYTARQSAPTYTNPYRETPEEREERHQRRREEAIEMAERMRDGEDPESPETEESETISVPAPVITRTSIISQNDDGWGAGISSLGNEPEMPEGDDRPFRCMFSRQEKLKNGQRVAVILLEEISINGIVIPKNTHIMGTCALSNRLEVKFESIEIGGRILPLGYDAYDMDGSKGIYCPDVGDVAKTARQRGTDIARNTLSSRLGRVAQDVVSTGVSIARNSSGETTVTVPSGYSFFIVKRKNL